MEMNLTGSYLGIRAVVSSMRKAGGGAIVNVSSGARFTATFGLAAYVASKWGVRGLTKTAALELGPTSASTQFTRVPFDGGGWGRVIGDSARCRA